MTLALVFSVAENEAITWETKRTIAVLATGFTLWTLLVQGTTLRLVIRALGLHELPVVEQAFRGQALSHALESTRQQVLKFVSRAGLDPAIVEPLVLAHEDRLQAVAEDGAFEEVITDGEKIRLGVAALVNQERNLLLDQRWASGLPSAMVDHYLFVLDRMRDEVRSDGRLGYLRSARILLTRSLSFRLAEHLHRRLGVQALLAAHLGSRFHMLLVSRIIVAKMAWAVEAELGPLLGERVAEILAEIVERRSEEIDRELETISGRFSRLCPGPRSLHGRALSPSRGAGADPQPPGRRGDRRRHRAEPGGRGPRSAPEFPLSHWPRQTRTSRDVGGSLGRSGRL